MALTYQDFTVASSVGGGGTLPLSVTLEAVSSAHLTVTLDGVTFASFTVSGTSGAYTVTCSGPLSAGSQIRVTRTTPATKAGRVVTYTDGAALDQDALNTSYLQLLYIFQELQEGPERDHAIAIVNATPAQTVYATASATWDTDAATKLQLDTITSSLNNTGSDVTVSTTTDEFALSAGKWLIDLEVEFANASAVTPRGSTVALRDLTGGTSYKLDNVADPANGFFVDRRGSASYTASSTNKTFLVTLSAYSSFEIHAATDSGAGTNISIPALRVVCERIGD